MLAGTAHTGTDGSCFVSDFVKPIFSILLFKVGIRTGRVWRGLVVIKIWFVNDLINIIQNHVGMNFFKQLVSVYVHKSGVFLLLTIITEGILIYNFRSKMQMIVSGSLPV